MTAEGRGGGEAARRQGRPAAQNAAAEPLALYVHWPFCRSKCPYCDFNSHVRESVDHARWREALCAEIAHYAAATVGAPLASLFFGGGTPSLMPPESVAAVIAAARAAWPFAEDVEITLEANPTSAEAARFAAYAAAGVNRISLGVQALDDAALAFLGRAHSAEEALEAVRMAAGAVSRWSFDLIYARPGQTVAAWRAELARALDHAGEHLSVYQLTFEKGTPFYAALRRGAISPPDEDTAAALYEATQETLEAAGLPAYEVSNHARPGAESRHNLVYWTGGVYVGVGPGGHGRLERAGTRLATEQIPAPEAWLAAVAAQGHGTRARRVLTPEERLAELVMTGLRLRAGIARETFVRRLGAAPEALLDAAALERLTDGGFLVLDAAGLRATEAGLLRLNAVIAALLG